MHLQTLQIERQLFDCVIPMSQKTTVISIYASNPMFINRLLAIGTPVAGVFMKCLSDV